MAFFERATQKIAFAARRRNQLYHLGPKNASRNYVPLAPGPWPAWRRSLLRRYPCLLAAQIQSSPKKFFVKIATAATAAAKRPYLTLPCGRGPRRVNAI